MPHRTITTLAKDYHLNPDQVRELFRLLEQKYSAPYILRYRKDLAANLSADDIAVMRRFLSELQTLENERAKILRKLKENGIENETIIKQIESAQTVSELLDYYVPYRPRRRSRSRLAQSRGLAELARRVVEHELDRRDLAGCAAEYVNSELDLNTASDVIEGTFHIISDWMAEEKSHRDVQRQVVDKKGHLVAARTGKWDRRVHEEFRQYGDFEEKLAGVHPCQMLCLMRGKRLGVLRYRVEIPKEDMFLQAAELYLENGKDEFYEIDAVFHEEISPPEQEKLTELTGPQLLYWCIRESITRTLGPILGKEKERELRDSAEQHTLDILRRILRDRLMISPIEKSRVLGIEPGFRTGCKLAALDEDGNVLDCRIIYPHTPKNQHEEAKKILASMIKEHELSVACIGNNNGCRETEVIMAELIAESCPDFHYTVVEAKPAEIYAGSPGADRELGKIAKKIMYTAIVLGRQIQKPLEEQTKVGLRNLCTSPYMKEVDKHDIERESRYVAEECIGEVGPDINTAPPTLLQYVPGLNYETACKIADWREQNGAFATRRALREVPEVDIEMWYKAAPFIRVTGSENPLDRTRIHPDHYRAAEAMLEQLGLEAEDLKDEEKRREIASKKGNVNLAELEAKFEMHYLYLKEMLDELLDPWPDPRLERFSFLLRQNILDFEQIKPLQMLHGTVQKVVDFGAFIDIGLSEDGLVHISELSEDFVESPYDVVFVGEQVTVWVVDIDPADKRIALSMRSEESAKRAAEKREKLKQRKETQQRLEQKRKEAQTAVPVADLPSSMQQAKSTAGRQSRRMQKIQEFGRQKTQKQAADQKQQDDGLEKKTPSKQTAAESENLQAGDLLKRLQFASIEKRGEDK